MKIADYRTKYGLSQTDFAEKLSAHGKKATQALISHYETEEVKVSGDRAIQIEKATDGEIPRWFYCPHLWEEKVTQ